MVADVYVKEYNSWIEGTIESISNDQMKIKLNPQQDTNNMTYTQIMVGDTTNIRPSNKPLQNLKDKVPEKSILKTNAPSSSEQPKVEAKPEQEATTNDPKDFDDIPSSAVAINETANDSMSKTKEIQEIPKEEIILIPTKQKKKKRRKTPKRPPAEKLSLIHI